MEEKRKSKKQGHISVCMTISLSLFYLLFSFLSLKLVNQNMKNERGHASKQRRERKSILHCKLKIQRKETSKQSNRFFIIQRRRSSKYTKYNKTTPFLTILYHFNKNQQRESKKNPFFLNLPSPPPYSFFFLFFCFFSLFFCFFFFFYFTTTTKSLFYQYERNYQCSRRSGKQDRLLQKEKEQRDTCAGSFSSLCKKYAKANLSENIYRLVFKSVMLVGSL